MTTTPDTGEYALKRARLQAILEARNTSTLVLTSPGVLGWLFGGARVQVSLVGEPVLAAVVRRDGNDTVPIFMNERARFEDEELPLGLPWCPFRGTPRCWHRSARPSETRSCAKTRWPESCRRRARPSFRPRWIATAACAGRSRR
ncbi:hypothetical protein [Frondihabitans sucicola]|uniref:hypothetical protein n=1 Tax=Frondihabitans sucicola TaxID=1268041 RepID=UPI00257343A2|nr:hypothetical protein [Frondihabitans sucicola]